MSLRAVDIDSTIDADISKEFFKECMETDEIDTTFEASPLVNYFYDPFQEDEQNRTTEWSMHPSSCEMVEQNGVSDSLLQNLQLVGPTILSITKNKAGSTDDEYDGSEAQFVNVYLNRDFYLTIQD